jgi:hypothetical protein
MPGCLLIPPIEGGRQSSPVTVVVVSSSGKGDRHAGSLDLKSPTARKPVGSLQGAEQLARHSECVNCESPEIVSSRETDCADIGNAEPVILGGGHLNIADLELSVLKSPGSVEDGMPGRNVQRKPGTSRVA